MTRAFPFAALLLAALFALPARAEPGTQIGVLVLGDHSAPGAIGRNGPVWRRVTAELSESMWRRGYRVIDEAMAASQLGWRAGSWRSKSRMLDMARRAAEQGTPGVRVVVLLNMSAHRVGGYGSGGSRGIAVRMGGEIYDPLANQYLDGFEMPEQIVPLPSRCWGGCQTDALAARAGEIAASLGDVLARKLGFLGARPNEAAPFQETPPEGIGGAVTTWSLTLQGLEHERAFYIIGVMSEEFPGYISHDLLASTSMVRNYEYVSTANRDLLREWLALLLTDMDLDPIRDVELSVKGNAITLTRIDPNRPKKEPKPRPRFR